MDWETIAWVALVASGIVIVARRERSQLRNKHDALRRLRVRLVDAQRVP
mgnify:CR=1 FL=1